MPKERIEQLEKPGQHYPPVQQTNYETLVRRYHGSTAFVSSFDGLRSFQSYIEIVKRGALMLPRIAQTLDGKPDSGLVLAFEDIQKNTDRYLTTEGAVSLDEKREKVLAWAEQKGHIEIRSAEERARRGFDLFCVLEGAVWRNSTVWQMWQYDNPTREQTVDPHHSKATAIIPIILPDGQELSVSHTFLHEFDRNEETVKVQSTFEPFTDLSVTLISDSKGILVDAAFYSNKIKKTTTVCDLEIRKAVDEIFGPRELLVDFTETA